MKECPKCGNAYPETFQYCPADGSPLDGDKENGESEDSIEPAQIKIKTLMLGIGVLVLCALIAFTAVFFYLYWMVNQFYIRVKLFVLLIDYLN